VKTTSFGALTFTVPWILDGASPDFAEEIMSDLPLPIRVVNRWILQPRYRRMVTAAMGAQS
jgi:hypothetical protein